MKRTKNDFNRFKKLRSKTRKRVLDSDKRFAKRTVEYFRKRNKCSVYKINQKVLVKYGKKGKKAPKRRHVSVGKIEKVGKYDMYKIGFRNLVNNQKIFRWFSVKDIADLQAQHGSNKKEIPEKNFTKDSKKWLNNQSISLMNKTTTYGSTHFVMETVNLVLLSCLERIWSSALTRSIKGRNSFIFGDISKWSQYHSFGFLCGCSIQQLLKSYEYRWDIWRLDNFESCS